MSKRYPPVINIPKNVRQQNYNKNCQDWIGKFPGFNWEKLFFEVNSKSFDQSIDQLLYPSLLSINAMKTFGKLKSNFLNITNKELVINPDWDEDSIMCLFQLIANHLNWNTPNLPKIVKRIDGMKNKCLLSDVKKIGLNQFLENNHIFSYAITSPKYFSYTSFGKSKKRVLDAKP